MATLLRNFMIIIHYIIHYFNIYCSLHASITLYITHIPLKDTVTRLTSTLIRSVECYKNDYHEKDTCINISTIITCTKVYNETLFSSV